MTVILMLIFICWFLVMDAIIKPAFIKQHRKPEPERGTYITTPGFEMLGALAQDGGEKLEKKKIADLTGVERTCRSGTGASRTAVPVSGDLV